MSSNLCCTEFTFLIITIFITTTIFISILLEESLYYLEKDTDYGPYDDQQPTLTPKPKPKMTMPILSRVKLPNHNPEDPVLVEDLASKMLPPCSHHTGYGYTQEEVKDGIGKFVHIKKLIYKDKENKYFLECGAGDGSSLSNTLYLEKGFYWKGLLVEADPAHFDNLIKFHRKAWIAPVCMSLNTSAYVARFKSSPTFEGRILTANESAEDVVKVVCYPFYTFTLAMNIKRIDYFSLSINGHEMEILEAIPFDKVYIAFISIDCSRTRGGLEGVKGFMNRNGFDVVGEYSQSEIIFVNMDEDYW